MSKRNVFYLTASLLLATIITGLAYYSEEQPIWITHEVFATGADPMSSTGVVGSPINKNSNKLPYSFQVGRVNSLTVHYPSIITSVKTGFIILGFTSSEPVDFVALASSEPVWGYSIDEAQRDVVLANVSDVYYYYDQIEFNENMILRLYFESDPKTLASVTLSGYKIPSFTVFNGVDEEIDEAVNIAKTFLLLNRLDVGKYIQHTIDYGVPNYFWHNNLGIKHPRLPSPCEYLVIRFEQADRPGHYYEVWVDPETNQIVGGDECK